MSAADAGVLAICLAVPAVYWALRPAQSRLDRRIHRRVTGGDLAPIWEARRRRWDIAVTAIWLVLVVVSAVSAE